MIFQDLDWVPANHFQAEDRAYRMGQTERVTVEYMLADGTLVSSSPPCLKLSFG